MSYTVSILPRAGRELARLPTVTYRRVSNAIRDLTAEPRPQGCLRLTGRDSWRIRVGVYRVIYEIDDTRQFVTVLQVGHRRDVYR